MFNKLFFILGIGAALLNLLLFGTLTSYCLLNPSGHTSNNFYQLLWCYIPLLLIGIIEFLINIRAKYRTGDLAIIVAIINIAFLWYLDISNTMLQYEVWIARGMPSPPTGRIFFLCAFIIIQLTTTIVMLRKIKLRAIKLAN